MNKSNESDLMVQFDESLLTDRAAMLDAIAPITQDSVDEEVQAIHYSANRTKNWVIGGLLLLLAISVVGNVAQSMRKPEFRILGVDQFGRTMSATNPDGLVPTPALAKTFLTFFVMDRYERLKSTITTKFPLQYLYLAKPVADEIKTRDRHDDVMANVLSGRVAENKVKVYPPQILSFAKQKFGNKTLWTGLAAIEIERTFVTHGPDPAHTDYWTIGVKFIMNPDQVPEKSADNPTYETVNPAGLTIIEAPSENHNPKPEARS